MANPKAALKKKKKEWFEISAPKDFNYRVIGETPAEEPEDIVGRTVTINLSRLVGDIKRQNTNVDFIVTDVKEGRCQTSVIKIWMQPSTVKRMVRTGSNKIDESVLLKTKDSISVRIKPMLITKSKIKGSVRRALRLAMLDEIKKAAEKSSYEQLVKSVIDFGLQKELKAKLDKIYPLRSAQIRAMELGKAADKRPKEPAAQKEEKKPMPEVKEGKKEEVAESKEEKAEAPEAPKEKPAEEAKPRKRAKKEKKAETSEQ